MTKVVPLRPELPTLASLPFVHDYWVRDPGARRGHNFRCFWNVSPSGDWGEDNALGTRLALEWLEFARANPGGHPASGQFGLIVDDMPPGGVGVTVGFWSIIAYAAAAGAAAGHELAAYWSSARETRVGA